MPVSGKRKEGLAKFTNKVQKLYLYGGAYVCTIQKWISKVQVRNNGSPEEVSEFRKL